MLINESQISSNLRRAAEEGLIALLNRKRLENLAFKYFGVYKDNELVGYRCPYSGKIYTDYGDIILEHIIPISSKGGTVLFNCIPASSEVNGLDEKGAKHLIEWWTHSKYWDEDAPIRLKSLVNYIIEGYNRVFDEYTIEELETSYLDILNEEEYKKEDDLQYSKRKESTIVKEQTESNKIYSYLTFLNDCIEVLDKNNIDTTTIKDNLKRLEERNIFKEIDKYTLYQNTLKKVIANILGDDNKAYLTYSLNIDIKKLMSIINEDEEEYIYKSLYTRFNNINIILKQNNLSIIDYFKNLMDIEDINLLYKNKVSQQEITEFIESIRLGHDSKINIFIEMLNHGEIDILSSTNQEKFTTYKKDENGVEIVNKVYDNIGAFWSRNKEIIMNQLFEGELKDNPKYDVARDIIDTYLMQNKNSSTEAKDRRIKVFIDMLNHGEIDILLAGNQKKFTIYKKDKNGNDIENKKYDNIRDFWHSNRETIMSKLFEGELKDNPEYDVARDIIDTYLMQNKNSSTEAKDRRIKVFIDMLNHGDIDIIIRDNQKKYTTYKKDEDGNDIVNKEYDDIRDFWHCNRETIMSKLFEGELKDNPEYDVARDTINTYLMKKRNYSLEARERKRKVFIDMLNHGDIDVLVRDNQKKFTTYKKDENGNDIIDKEYDVISDYWRNNKDIIIHTLFEGELKDNPEYDVARDTIDTYLMKNTNNSSEAKERRIKVFIDMLNHGEIDILIQKSKKKYTTYKKDEDGNDIVNKEYDEIGSCFWKNKDIIINKLFEGELKDNPEYDVARNTIFKYYKISSIEEYYEKKKEKKEYKANLSQEEIKFQNNFDARIRVFIEMLNDDKTITKDNNGKDILRNSWILSESNNEKFEGFPNTLVRYFFGNNKDIIIYTLFEGELKDDPKYDVARDTIDTYLMKNKNNSSKAKERRIKVFIDMLNHGEIGILIQKSKKKYTTYKKDEDGNDIVNKEYDKVGSFFWENKDIIINKLFEGELKDNPEYDIARNTILKYYKVSSIEEYYEKEKKKKELKELKKLEKETLEIEESIDKEDISNRRRA